MREIKFRYVFTKKGVNPLLQIITLEEIECGNVEEIPGWKITEKNQFTGLKDKNGIEIYEGDICRFDVKSKGYKEEMSEGKTVIVWNERNARFDFRGSFNGLIYKNYEVVGNIYENPELLREGK